MPFKPSYEDPALRDGIASLPEMEDIQLELPLSQQAEAENRVDANWDHSNNEMKFQD
ncbi:MULTISPECIES: hypothetical protein [Agrobacterium]|jgi:hypothetical protein|uniref:hypothetical protein n=1 Tax=Agrobacterium TaxID=357 RepID=UPI0005DAFA33|nr:MULTISPECIES: hypothetical protein [Agrobacterium]KIV67048.1 hypothetical protein SZ54_1205 [Rhizobium sp. UR51a]MBA8800987.1 hypothetical protein [Agrobacterium sp. RC10-4-1]WMW58803.1 hypothetical protein RE411_23090 [Agrobacterium pusense]